MVKKTVLLWLISHRGIDRLYSFLVKGPSGYDQHALYIKIRAIKKISLRRKTRWEIFLICVILVNTRRSPNAGLMLGQSRRRWAIIKPTLSELLVFAVMAQNGLSNVK